MHMDLVAGIDIGGTKTKLGLVTNSGKCVVDMNFRTKEYPDLEDFLDKTAQSVHELIKKVPSEVNLLGVGVGAPNASNKRGTIEHAANLYWKGIVPLQKKLQERLDLPMKVTNDANAAALGEMSRSRRARWPASAAVRACDRSSRYRRPRVAG